MDKNKLPFERAKKEILVRKEASTSDKFGCDPKLRPIKELIDYGIVNIDKPRGPTSHQVSAYVQKILGIKKSGHSGTLDPKVTGVLPVALGRGTRIVQALLSAGKEYVTIMHMHDVHDKGIVAGTCKKFVGKIKQLPPIKSNVKRQERYRKIYYLEIIEIKDKDVLFVVGTQAGTYIRKLIHDIGQAMGTGAHMAELRRTKAGPFNETTLATLQDLADAYHYYKEEGNENPIRHIIKPIEFAVLHLPKVWIIDTTVDTICHGASLKVPGISKVESDIQIGESVAIMSLKDELVALGTASMISKDMQKKEKGIAVRTSKVFMKTGTYPKIEKNSARNNT
ncbi:RNA-guided pseudouridylation complex pseudouridine synthase subunit Cbf5 [Candidatus Woesearchaeota archaeon]|nr:RNA-guided pseudouridylation complex pseudouridine synthase subunit Cbf5 [Candidatus Woesearchaeota archaeon]